MRFWPKEILLVEAVYFATLLPAELWDRQLNVWLLLYRLIGYVHLLPIFMRCWSKIGMTISLLTWCGSWDCMVVDGPQFMGTLCDYV